MSQEQFKWLSDWLFGICDNIVNRLAQFPIFHHYEEEYIKNQLHLHVLVFSFPVITFTVDDVVEEGRLNEMNERVQHFRIKQKDYQDAKAKSTE